MMIDKRLINTVADSKKWIGVTVLWNWVALVVVGWALAHQQTIVRYFGGLNHSTLSTHNSFYAYFFLF
ncbi:TPA: ABC transporter [Haemophilus influenzae]